MMVSAIRLDDRRLTTGQVGELSGVPEKDIENWIARGLLPVGAKLPSGRWAYSLLDAIYLAAMHGVTRRVPLGPMPAAQLAAAVVAYVTGRMSRDPEGRVFADLERFDLIPHTQAFALAVIEGEWRIQEVAIGKCYADREGPWGRAHVIVPVAQMFAEIVMRALESELTQ